MTEENRTLSDADKKAGREAVAIIEAALNADDGSTVDWAVVSTQANELATILNKAVPSTVTILKTTGF